MLLVHERHAARRHHAQEAFICFGSYEFGFAIGDCVMMPCRFAGSEDNAPVLIARHESG